MLKIRVVFSNSFYIYKIIKWLSSVSTYLQITDGYYSFGFILCTLIFRYGIYVYYIKVYAHSELQYTIPFIIK